MSAALVKQPELHARFVGPRDGEVVFGLHGWSGDHRTFDALLPSLPPGAGLFTVDQPGFGASGPPVAWDFDAFSAPLLAALDREGIERCTLVGSCAGGIVGLELALRAPERFERLVLVDPFAYVPWYFRLLTAGWPGWFFYHATFANPVGRWVTNLALAGQRSEDTDLTGGFEAARHEAAFRYLRLLCSDADASRYAQLELPITMLYGARTFTAVKRSVRMFQALWPQATCHEVAGAGHLPIEEATSQVARLVFGERDGPYDEENFDGVHESRRVPDAVGDAPDRPHLGHDPRLGATLPSDRARAL